MKNKTAHAHTLSLRLTEEAYRQLRRFALLHEERTAERVTHQGVLEQALAEFLDRATGQTAGAAD